MNSPFTEGARHRRESCTRSNEPRPLFTTAALPLDRKKQPQPQPKKRKRPSPVTPPLNFDPKQSRIRSGRQDVVPPTPSLSCMTSPDRSQGDQYEDSSDFTPHNGSPYNAQPPIASDLECHKRPRVFSQTISCLPTAGTEMGAAVEPYSPSAHTPSPPAMSNQSPTYPTENVDYEEYYHSCCANVPMDGYQYPLDPVYPSQTYDPDYTRAMPNSVQDCWSLGRH